MQTLYIVNGCYYNAKPVATSTEKFRKKGTMVNYFSQYGQDRYLDGEVFKGKERGFFVDIGANDGVTFSNSLFFEKERKWDGVCIEPLPAVFQKLTGNRSCRCYECAISDGEGEADFIHVDGPPEMLSGLEKNYHRRHLRRVKRELRRCGRGERKVITVRTRTLQSIMGEMGVDRVDFCSIDTEGSEMSIVKSIDFDRIRIECLVIENNYRTMALGWHLRTRGYVKLRRLGKDEVFLRDPSAKDGLSAAWCRTLLKLCS